MSNEMTPNERKESIEALVEMVNEFESKIEEIISDGRDIVRGCMMHDGQVRREGMTMDGYLVKRLRNFIEGYEQFKFDSMREALEEERQEIEAGVYGELEEEAN
ncbi:MAG: hypothetical protein K0R18_310 [Bacillales bacterium]|nr:hypothetical protein [Bacillales bacterium]